LAYYSDRGHSRGPRLGADSVPGANHLRVPHQGDQAAHLREHAEGRAEQQDHRLLGGLHVERDEVAEEAEAAALALLVQLAHEPLVRHLFQLCCAHQPARRHLLPFRTRHQR